MLLFNCGAALQLILLIVTLYTCWCDAEKLETFLQLDLDAVDKSCGLNTFTGCCPNLQHKFDEGTITLNATYKGGPNTCKCRCSDEDGTADSPKLIRKVVSGSDADEVDHFFCKAGFGPTVESESGGSNGGAGGADGSVSEASVLQLCNLMVFVVLMAAGTIMLISYE